MSDDLIRRPDGSYVKLSEQTPRIQLSHELAEKLFPLALQQEQALTQLKALALRELRAHRDMMLSDYGLKIVGKEGGFSVRTVCGTKRVGLEISKTIAFNSEIEAARQLIEQFLEAELEGSSDPIKEIITGVFKLNTNGRLDTAGIIGLRHKHKFDHPIWQRAMDAIDAAIIDDQNAIYVRFYNIDTERKTEERVKLNISEV